MVSSTFARFSSVSSKIVSVDESDLERTRACKDQSCMHDIFTQQTRAKKQQKTTGNAVPGRPFDQLHGQLRGWQPLFSWLLGGDTNHYNHA